MPLSEGGKGLTICAFVKIQYQSVTDGRTDGQTNGFAKAISRCAYMHSMPAPDKMVKSININQIYCKTKGDSFFLGHMLGCKGSAKLSSFACDSPH